MFISPIFRFKVIVHPKKKNSVINYSPSCCSKPARPLFIFRTHIKIFLMKSESFLALHRQQHNWHVQGIVIFSPCDISCSTLILWSYKNTFENKNNNFIQQFLLFHVSLWRTFTTVPWRIPLLVNKAQHILVLCQNAGSCVSSNTRMCHGYSREWATETETEEKK